MGRAKLCASSASSPRAHLFSVFLSCRPSSSSEKTSRAHLEKSPRRACQSSTQGSTRSTTRRNSVRLSAEATSCPSGWRKTNRRQAPTRASAYLARCRTCTVSRGVGTKDNADGSPSGPAWMTTNSPLGSPGRAAATAAPPTPATVRRSPRKGSARGAGGGGAPRGAPRGGGGGRPPPPHGGGRGGGPPALGKRAEPRLRHPHL